MIEQWRPIAGYEGLYEVSDLGRIRSLKPPRGGDGVLKGDVNYHGYRRVVLIKDKARKRHAVHRVVCAAFKGPPPDGTECGHRNGNSMDNCASNLEWITRSGNSFDALRHGTHTSQMASNPRSQRAKISEGDVPIICEAYAAGVSQRMLGRQYGVSDKYIYKILKGKKKPRGRTRREAPNTLHTHPNPKREW